MDSVIAPTISISSIINATASAGPTSVPTVCKKPCRLSCSPITEATCWNCTENATNGMIIPVNAALCSRMLRNWQFTGTIYWDTHSQHLSSRDFIQTPDCALLQWLREFRGQHSHLLPAASKLEFLSADIPMEMT